jgi:hypothetical protein
MQLKFWWEEASPHEDRPYVSIDGVQPLSCSILMDDAGLGVSHILSWTAEGLRRITSVEDGKFSEGEWATEAFCAEFDAERTTVASLLDATWRPTTLATSAFRRMLMEWRDFIQSTSRPTTREVEI